MVRRGGDRSDTGAETPRAVRAFPVTLSATDPRERQARCVSRRALPPLRRDLAFLVIGVWDRRREVGFGPGYLYALFLLGFCTILTPIHVPGGQFYNATKPEECFATEAAAQAAGYRRSLR